MIAGVHDSYWTHACDVDMMNKILREKFVELYEAPILENVSIFLKHFKLLFVMLEYMIIFSDFVIVVFLVWLELFTIMKLKGI